MKLKCPVCGLNDEPINGEIDDVIIAHYPYDHEDTITIPGRYCCLCGYRFNDQELFVARMGTLYSVKEESKLTKALKFIRSFF